MKLWLLRPRPEIEQVYDSEVNPWEPWYDKVFGFVIRAESEYDARRIACNRCGDEGPRPWTNPEHSKCVELTATGEEDMIMRDCRWA